MACVPSAATHEMVKTVGPARGTVAPPPLKDVCEKLPSGDVSVHDAAFLEFQKIVVRPPKGAEAGTAQISTCIGGEADVG